MGRQFLKSGDEVRLRGRVVLVLDTTTLVLAQVEECGIWCSDIAATETRVGGRTDSILSLVVSGFRKDIRRFFIG